MNVSNFVLAITAFFAGLSQLEAASDACTTVPEKAILEKTETIAEGLMKQCVHLLDKYPVPLSTIAESMRAICNDYVMCHDKFENLASNPDAYRKELLGCVKPEVIKFYKSRPEFKHDPVAASDEVGGCMMDHIPLDKSLGVGVGYHILKMMGADA